jgi:hypothetical protein
MTRVRLFAIFAAPFLLAACSSGTAPLAPIDTNDYAGFDTKGVFLTGLARAPHQ